MNVDRKIVGVFRTIDDAALVINELNEKGYSADNISAIAKDQKEIEHLEEKSGEKVNSETAHKADIFFSDRACSWRSSRRTRWFINRSWYTCRFWNGSNCSSRTNRSSYWRSWYWRRSWKFNRSIYRLRNPWRPC